MGILKIVNRNYSTSNEDASFVNAMDETMIAYIMNPEKTKGLIFGFNTLLSSPADMAEQFIIVRKIFHKEDGRLLRHFIISFAEDEIIDEKRAFYYGITAANYYANKYQIVFGIHQDTKNIHIHFLMNTVSYVDGSKFSEGILGFGNFLHYLNKINPAITIENCKSVITEELV